MKRKRFTVVCGVSESGKTTFALRYLLNEPGLALRCLFDPDGEFSEKLGLPAVRTASDLDNALFTGWVCYCPPVGQTEAALRFFAAWAMRQAANVGKRTVLVVDELWKHCSPHAVPVELQAVLTNGRKVGLEGMFITQAPNRINGVVLGESTEIVCFRLQEPAGLSRVAEYGHDRDEVKNLAPGRFVSLSSGGGILRGRVF